MTQETDQVKFEPVSKEITKQYDVKVGSLETEVKALQVVDQASLQKATDLIRQIETFKKAANDERLKATRPLDGIKQTIMGWFAPMVDKCDELSGILRDRNQAFLNEQERIRKEEQAKADAKAKAEEEAKRKEKERQAEEWEKKEAEKIAEANRLRDEGKPVEAVKVLAEAAKCSDKAEERREEAASVQVQSHVVPTKVAVPKGVAQKTVWNYRITDVEKIPRQFMIPNDELLKKQASACQDKVKIDGVEFYPTQQTAYRKG